MPVLHSNPGTFSQGTNEHMAAQANTFVFSNLSIYRTYLVYLYFTPCEERIRELDDFTVVVPGGCHVFW
jgi:hypothetical protein